MSQSSLLRGHGRASISFPYQTRLAAETQEHWRLLEEAESVPFHHWNSATIVAWVSTGLGELINYIHRVGQVEEGTTIVLCGNNNLC